MKATTIAVLSVLLLTTLAFSQPYWQLVSTGNHHTREMAFRGANEIYFAGLNGLMRSTNLGVNWTPVIADSEAASIGVTSAGTLLCGFYNYQNFELRRSTNGGQSWTTTRTSENDFFSFKVASNGNIFCANYHGVLRSTNDGVSWTQYGGAWSFHVNDLVPLPNDTLIVATNRGILRLRYDGTGNVDTVWGYDCRALVRVPNRCLYVSTNNGVFMSVDYGNTWSLTFGQSAFTAMTADSTNRAYACKVSDSTVQRTTNNGTSWQLYSQGMTLSSQNAITAMGYQSSTGYLYAATPSNIYRTINPVVAVNEPTAMGLPTSVQLLSAYPNPFNPTTTISYSLPVASDVSLRLFDANGREIQQLFSGKQTAGVHSVTLDGSGLASGTYFCRMSANGQSYSRALQLIK